MEIAAKALANTHAQQLVLSALVMTHPDPAAVADVLEQMLAHGQVEQAMHGQAAPDVRQAVHELVAEIRDIARMEAARRAAPPTSVA